MPSLRPICAAIRLAVTCLVLAIGLRSWLVMGLIEPVIVAGSSMAPTLCGAYVTPQCPDCGHKFRVGAEFAASAATVACPQCMHASVPLGMHASVPLGMQASVPLAGLPWRHGDRLWIDRTTFGWRAPERWEVVVAHNPHDGSELCVKRVAGLPGETIALRDGNVLVDGAVLAKTIAQQRQLRQVVHREQLGEKLGGRRWQAEQTSAWQWSGNAWQHQQKHHQRVHGPGDNSPGAKRRQPLAPSRHKIDWLEYQHPRAQPLTDDVTYNAGLTRQLQLVDEFMLSAALRVRGEGTLALSLDDGTSTGQVQLQFPGGAAVLLMNGQPGATAQLSAPSRQRLATGKVVVEFSNFDRQLLLAIDGQVEICHPWPAAEAVGTDRPVSIGAQGIAVRLDSLTLYRDLYYGSQAVGVRPAPPGGWRLAADEYFLLGDNSPVSLDSRRWGPVPRRLMVGKPLGIR